METKVCPRCGEEKEIENFGTRGKTKVWRAYCRECLNKIQRHRNKERKRKIIDLLGGECVKCGYKKNLSALEFHHLNPKEKEYEWNKAKLLSWNKLIKEIKKCILVCSNCHREIHNPENVFIDLIDNSDNKFLNREQTEIAPTGICPSCGENVFGTIYCTVKCASFSKRKIKERPTYEELKKMIELSSYCEVGRRYGVTDNAIRKWVKQYEKEIIINQQI